MIFRLRSLLLVPLAVVAVFSGCCSILGVRDQRRLSYLPQYAESEEKPEWRSAVALADSTVETMSGIKGPWTRLYYLRSGLISHPAVLVVQYTPCDSATALQAESRVQVTLSLKGPKILEVIRFP
jgi:hypothetical protein